jgi:hypothetical protein
MVEVPPQLQKTQASILDLSFSTSAWEVHPTANAAVKNLEELGLIGETTGNKKNRSFSYSAYINLLSQ